MRISLYLFKFSFVVVVASLSATALHADTINIPDDYATIQAGIDASSDADTVLVQPGTYYENINFNGKNIVLGSLFITTQDTSFISKTVIDGDKNGSVVTFESGEDSTTVLSGFTIQRGEKFYIGSIYHVGGGIYCKNSSPNLNNLFITKNFDGWGGGIRCENSSSVIENVGVSENIASDGGGGLFCGGLLSPILKNVTISNNTCWADGGGIYCNAEPQLISVTITRNKAIASGGGIFCNSSESLLLVNLTVSENTAFFGGGIFCHYVEYEITPSQIELYQNYPNPFNSTTTICYNLPKTSLVNIAIHNVLGQKVRDIVNQRQQSGFHNVVWNGKDNRGKYVSTGVYLIKLQSDNIIHFEKIQFLK